MSNSLGTDSTGASFGAIPNRCQERPAADAGHGCLQIQDSGLVEPRVPSATDAKDLKKRMVFVLALRNLLPLGPFVTQPGVRHEHQSKCLCVRQWMV